MFCDSLLISRFVNVNSKTKEFLLCLAGSLILAISAKISVPFYPVPFTLQTLAVLLIGSTLGKRLGLYTVLLYLAEGMAGLPVFAAGVGISIIFTPSFGYLIGFAFSAYIAGYAAEMGRDRNILSSLPWLAVAHQVVFVCAVLWLSVPLGLAKAFKVGYLPFFGADVVKFTIASVSLHLSWKYINKYK